MRSIPKVLVPRGRIWLRLCLLIIICGLSTGCHSLIKSTWINPPPSVDITFELMTNENSIGAAYPVVDTMRAEAIMQLKQKQFEEISEASYRSMSGDASPPKAKRYFLIRASQAASTGAFMVYFKNGKTLVNFSGIGRRFKGPINVPVVVGMKNPPTVVYTLTSAHW